MKYFLLEYEAFRKQEVKEYGDIVDIFEYNDTSIEHILPQDYSKWEDVVMAFSSRIPSGRDKGDGYAEKVLVNTLGNLMLIRAQKNSSLQNDPWHIKRVRYETGTYNEREVADKNLWTSSEIAERGQKLLHFLSDKLGMSREVWTQELMNQALYNNGVIAAAMTSK